MCAYAVAAAVAQQENESKREKEREGTMVARSSMALVAGCAPRAHHHDRVNARNGCQHRLARYFLSCGHRPLMSHTLSLGLGLVRRHTRTHAREKPRWGRDFCVPPEKLRSTRVCTYMCVCTCMRERESTFLNACVASDEGLRSRARTK